MEIGCPTIVFTDTYIKVKIGNILLSMLVEFHFPVDDDRFYSYDGVNFTFGLLNCDRYTGDIVIPWIVKSGFFSPIFYCNTGRVEKILIVLSGISLYQRSLYRGSKLYRKVGFKGEKRLGLHNNWFILSVRMSSYGCMREVWRTREKGKSCSRRSFVSALQTSQVHP